MVRLCTILCATALLTGVAPADEQKPRDRAPDIGATPFDKCGIACSECQRTCNQCATHCAKMLAAGKKEHLAALAACHDCATVCAAAACIVARHGPFADTICKACAEACQRCGAECDKFKEMPVMKQCADECRRCEKECREMLGHLRDDAPKK